MNTTITFEWTLPHGSAYEDTGTFTAFISPSPLSHPSKNEDILPPWNVTLAYNTNYSVYVMSENCAGTSSSIFIGNFSCCELSCKLITILADCGTPVPPPNGIINYSQTWEGANITFICSSGFYPTALMTSTCMNTGFWIPLPEKHECSLIKGMLAIIMLLTFIGQNS